MGCSEWTFDGMSPIHIQLYKRLKFVILSGQLRPGESLPPIRQMATVLGFNINTVAKSYKLLSQDGLTITQRDRKCSVISDSSFIREKRNQEATALYRNYIRAMEALGFSKKEAQILALEH